MEVINQVLPTDPAKFEEMIKPGPEGPVFMLNLLKYKDKAEYEDGRETDLTGREAYQLYIEGVAGVLPKFGAQVLFKGDITFLPLGEVEELWDEIAIVAYPDRASLVSMGGSEEWQNFSVHRAAGLSGQLNIESVASDSIKALPWIAQLIEAMR